MADAELEARNAPLEPSEVHRVKSDYADFRRRNRKMVGARGADRLNPDLAGTLYTSCDSRYLGANVPGKSRVFMPLFGFPACEARSDAVAA